MTSQLREGDLFFLGILRAARMLTRFFDDGLRSVGLTCGQFSILASVYSAQSISMKPLATRLAMDRTTLTAALKALQRERLVSTAADANDRRRRMISITASGRKRLLRALPIWAEKCRVLAEILQDEDWFQDVQTIGYALASSTGSSGVH
ncbi:MAG TPA: MarR family winged helix-turn-helix transcriptional regulator [Rhizomicrobium sp.]|nr:MarR family winged helix-turn-helix transcriptional regulator [Rhizomicrobium sp.]